MLAVEARSLPSEPPRHSSDLLTPFDDHGLRAVDPIADARPGYSATAAPAKGAKPGQIALAWLLHKGDDIARIQAPNGAAIWKRTSPRNPSRSAKRKCRRSRLAYYGEQSNQNLPVEDAFR